MYQRVIPLRPRPFANVSGRDETGFRGGSQGSYARNEILTRRPRQQELAGVVSRQAPQPVDERPSNEAVPGDGKIRDVKKQRARKNEVSMDVSGAARRHRAH